MKDFFTMKNAKGLSVLYRDEQIKGDETYLKRLIKSGEQFILLSGSFEAKKWNRFGKTENGDYFYMSDTQYDGVVFKPKNDIYFLGFGLMN